MWKYLVNLWEYINVSEINLLMNDLVVYLKLYTYVS